MNKQGMVQDLVDNMDIAMFRRFVKAVDWRLARSASKPRRIKGILDKKTLASSKWINVELGRLKKEG